jgi:hypothetical protein
MAAEQSLQPLALLLPLVVMGIEDLREPTPPHVTHENSLLLRSRRAPLGFESFQQLDGREVILTFPFERTGPELVSGGNPIIVLVSKRFICGRHYR